MSLTFLIVAQVALWAVVLVLLLMVLGLMRQVGTLLERVSPAGISAADSVSYRVGDSVKPIVAAGLIDGQTIQIGGALSARAQLIAFVAPQCTVCKSLLPRLEQLADEGAAHVKMTFALAMEEGGDIGPYTRSKKIAAVDAQELAAPFAAAHLPHIVIIREDGQLAVSAPARSQEEFETLAAPIQAAINRTGARAPSLESLV